MKTARRTKQKQPRGATRRKLHQSKSAFISQAEARRRAARHYSNLMFKGATVRDGAEANINTYGIRHEDAWVVYLNQQGFGLQSANVVVVCKRTGRVLYVGSAGDEG